MVAEVRSELLAFACRGRFDFLNYAKKAEINHPNYSAARCKTLIPNGGNSLLHRKPQPPNRIQSKVTLYIEKPVLSTLPANNHWKTRMQEGD